MRSLKLLVAVLVTVASVVLGSGTAEADSPVQIAGRAQCSNGGVQHVWIDAQTSTSGWAHTSPDYDAGVLGVLSILYDFRLDRGGAYRVKVTCADGFWTSDAQTDWIQPGDNPDLDCGTTHPLLALLGNVVFGEEEYVGAIHELDFNFSSGVPYGHCQSAGAPTQIPAVGPTGTSEPGGSPSATAAVGTVPDGCASPQYVNSVALTTSSGNTVGTLTQYWGWCNGGGLYNWATVHLNAAAAEANGWVGIQTDAGAWYGQSQIDGPGQDFVSVPVATTNFTTRAFAHFDALVVGSNSGSFDATTAYAA